jgi:hypothetical protein
VTVPVDELGANPCLAAMLPVTVPVDEVDANPRPAIVPAVPVSKDPRRRCDPRPTVSVADVAMVAMPKVHVDVDAGGHVVAAPVVANVAPVPVPIVERHWVNRHHRAAVAAADPNPAARIGKRPQHTKHDDGDAW